MWVPETGTKIHPVAIDLYKTLNTFPGTPLGDFKTHTIIPGEILSIARFISI